MISQMSLLLLVSFMMTARFLRPTWQAHLERSIPVTILLLQNMEVNRSLGRDVEHAVFEEKLCREVNLELRAHAAPVVSGYSDAPGVVIPAGFLLRLLIVICICIYLSFRLFEQPLSH